MAEKIKTKEQVEQGEFSLCVAPTRKDWVYLAGIVDGEGCLTCSKHGDHLRGVDLNVANTDKRLIDWLHRMFGGHVYERTKNPGNSRRAWKWAVKCKELIWVLENIIPHLKLKREQAVVIWKVQTVRGWANHNRPGRQGWDAVNPEIPKFYRRCYRAIRTLNQTGHTDAKGGYDDAMDEAELQSVMACPPTLYEAS